LNIGIAPESLTPIFTHQEMLVGLLLESVEQRPDPAIP
jgi:hypothetical protein